ncbi:hypothetical protein BDV26DRAFT_296510 [Aspergillus bertholletiae]|uniref:Uncharacterized protein n=1 Tax=Aspergillus bertholletiae TaxID=1226010 RepID=A0A5N7AXY0_9EURO|nr:hypothetical protein BDV26DRAFT_296510 [Aspergillus bertholletiae]
MTLLIRPSDSGASRELMPSQPCHLTCQLPFTTEFLGPQQESLGTTDSFPACFRQSNNQVEVPRYYPDEFVSSELSLKRLEALDRHLWFAGAKRPPKPLRYQISIGREIVVSEQMDLHLLWANDGRIFIKPLPRFLLDSKFWRRFFLHAAAKKTSSLTFIAVGLATDRLKENKSFMAASYGFTVFAILGPLCAFGLVLFEAFYHFIKDLPWLLRRKPNSVYHSTGSAHSSNAV